MKLRAFFTIFAVVALLLSFGAVRDEARADAILFPYVVTSDTVATIVSVVNHTSAADVLHLGYYYKKTTDNVNTDCCNEVDFEVPTTFEDIVSFDVNAHLAANGGPLFNDATNYNGADFAMGITNPRRAFLIVDNRVNGAIGGDSLYGEAMVIELGSGAAYDYRAYNSVDNNHLNPDFSNAMEVHGEVIAAGERTPIAILPPDEWQTAFTVTPIGNDGGGQDYGGYNAAFTLYGVDATGRQVIAMWDRDENPISGAIPQDIVCVGSLKLDMNVLLSEGSYNRIKDQGGWSFVDISAGTKGKAAGCDAQRAIYAVDEAVVLKLEYNLGNTIGGTTVPGIVNTNIWLEDNTGGMMAACRRALTRAGSAADVITSICGSARDWSYGNDAVNPIY